MVRAVARASPNTAPDQIPLPDQETHCDQREDDRI